MEALNNYVVINNVHYLESGLRSGTVVSVGPNCSRKYIPVHTWQTSYPPSETEFILRVGDTVFFRSGDLITGDEFDFISEVKLLGRTSGEKAKS